MNNHPHITTFYRLLWVFHWHRIHFTMHFMLVYFVIHFTLRTLSSVFFFFFSIEVQSKTMTRLKKIQLNLVRLIWHQTTYVQECGISGRIERDHNITETDKTVGVIQWVDITPNITFSHSKCIGHTF